MDYLVTVICTTYNQVSYIKDALDGFVMQETDFKFKVIVHDDASTDGTTEIVKDYQRKYPDIIFPIIQNENLISKGESRKPYINPLIEGKYICFCEGDDYWIDKFKLSKQVKFLESHKEYCICATSTNYLIVKDNTISNKFQTHNDREVSLKEVLYELNGPPYHYSSMMVRKEVYFDMPNWRNIMEFGNLGNSLASVNFGKIWMIHDVTSVYRSGAIGSWTNATSNLESRIYYCNMVINSLKLFDKETNYKYHKIVCHRINTSFLDICLFQKNYFDAIFKKGLKGFIQTPLRRKLTIIYEAIYYGILKH